MLSKKNNLLIFGESITDETFIRRLKPLKKGPFRIGFDTMVDTNWEKDIKIQVIGLNYTLPNLFRSEIFMNYGKIFHLKDYKKIYLNHPEKAINLLRKEVQSALENEVVHIDKVEYYDVFEKLLMISFKGLNPYSYDKKLSLSERYLYSKQLANKFNQYIKNDNDFDLFTKKINKYFELLKLNGINDSQVFHYINKSQNKLWVNILELIISFPLCVFGLIFNYIPYVITSSIVEKIFKRPVFWNAVKVLIGGLIGFIFQFIILLFIYFNFIDNLLLTGLIGLLLPISGIFSYEYFRFYADVKSQFNLNRTSDLKNIVELRSHLSSILSDI